MKYMGSKDKIADNILPFIHSYILMENADTYIEPFVGGANMIDKVICTNRFGYDKNKYLIALFSERFFKSVISLFLQSILLLLTNFFMFCSPFKFCLLFALRQL